MTQMNKTKIVKNEQKSAYLTLCMLGNFAFFSSVGFNRGKPTECQAVKFMTMPSILSGLILVTISCF